MHKKLILLFCFFNLIIFVNCSLNTTKNDPAPSTSNSMGTFWGKDIFSDKYDIDVLFITNPENAEVYIDDNFEGQTPLKITYGGENWNRRLKIVKDGYKPIEQTVHMTKNARYNFNLVECDMRNSTLTQQKLPDSDNNKSLLSPSISKTNPIQIPNIVSLNTTKNDPNAVAVVGKLGFPSMLAGMEFTGVFDYDNIPELGLSIRYERRSLIYADIYADIYVYDGGLNDIPNGCDNELVKAQAASIGRQLKILQERGGLARVKSLNSGVKPTQGTIQFTWNKYQYFKTDQDENTDTGTRLSESFVTGFDGKFIKIRLTYRKEKSLDGNKVSERLIKEIVQLLKVAATPQEGEKRVFKIEIDETLPVQLMAAWISYFIRRQIYIIKHEDRYPLFPGVIISKFEDELEGRKTLAQIWKELKEKDNNLKDEYLNKLELVHDTGFMREYVWLYLRRASWKKPDNLKLIEFENWKNRNLENHNVESHGNIRVAIVTTEPEDALDIK